MTIASNLCKFQPNRSKEVAKEFNGLIKNLNYYQFPCFFLLLFFKLSLLDLDPGSGGKINANPCGPGFGCTALIVTPTVGLSFDHGPDKCYGAGPILTGSGLCGRLRKKKLSTQI